MVTCELGTSSPPYHSCSGPPPQRDSQARGVHRWLPAIPRTPATRVPRAALAPPAAAKQKPLRLPLHDSPDTARARNPYYCITIINNSNRQRMNLRNHSPYNINVYIRIRMHIPLLIYIRMYIHILVSINIYI